MQLDRKALAELSGVDLARYYAKQGARVLPVAPAPAKRPLIGKWQDKATDDLHAIEEWWRQHPEARVGIATGDPGFDVADFDVSEGKPGLEQMAKLMDLGLIQPGTFYLVRTISGGRHLYFKGSDQRNKQNEKAIPGVDFRGAGGMVLAAGNEGYELIGSAHDGLAGVEWDRIRAALAPPEPPPTARPAGPPTTQPGRTPTGIPPAPSQAVPVDTGRRTSRLVAPARGYDDPIGEESPLDWYTRNHEITDLLADAGWKFSHEQGGRLHYARPGKDPREGVSGNIAEMHDGRRVFYNFSSSVDMPTDTALSTAQLYAWMYHGGDMRAAASTIRRTLMPQRERVATPTAPAPPGTNRPPAPGTTTPPQPASAGTIVPVSEVGPPEPVHSFWQRRPELAELWWKSQQSGTSPWANLGRILAHVAARVGPHVMLPPPGGIGAPSSLNVMVALSGNSGTGKGQSSGVAREFVGAPWPPEMKPGTGQGIAAMFTDQTREGPVQMNETALVNEDEVTNLGAHAELQGSNLVSTLLGVYMGEELGEHYANKEKRRPVKPGHYRLALTVGVQPGNSHLILDHSESGFPQRFVWMPAFWAPAIPRSPLLRSPAPGPGVSRWHGWSAIWPTSLDDTIEAEWSPTDVASDHKGKKEPEVQPVVIKEPLIVRYSPKVQRQVDRDRWNRLNELRRREEAGEDNPGDPDSHLLLARLKVATLLAMWLDGQAVISDDIWDLSGWVIWVSNDTRTRAMQRLRDKAQNRTAQRAQAQVAVQAIVNAEQERKHTEMHRRVADRIVTILGGGDWQPMKVINQGIAGRDKARLREGGETIQDILAEMALTGVIESREPEGGERGARYRNRRR